ncbi:hypothetical protein FQZ97_1235410 [compost metagenome]
MVTSPKGESIFLSCIEEFRTERWFSAAKDIRLAFPRKPISSGISPSKVKTDQAPLVTDIFPVIAETMIRPLSLPPMMTDCPASAFNSVRRFPASWLASRLVLVRVY